MYILYIKTEFIFYDYSDSLTMSNYKLSRKVGHIFIIFYVIHSVLFEYHKT